MPVTVEPFVVGATVKGSLLGAPADGKPVRLDAVDIYRVTDGKISEEWAVTARGGDLILVIRGPG